MKEIVIKQSFIKQLKILFYGIIMISASVFLLILDTNALIKVIGIIGTGFFSLCMIFIVLRFLNPKPVLTIKEDGFIEQSNAASIGFVSWDHVEDITITKLLNQQFISVKINNVDEVLKNISSFKKATINSNIKLGYAPITINLQSTKESYKDILNLMKEYFEAYKIKE